MRIVLWDTHWGGVFKDFAGGYGVGTLRGKCVRTRFLERMYSRDFRPVGLARVGGPTCECVNLRRAGPRP